MFADVPATGGTAIAADGTTYMSDNDRSRIITVSPSGGITTLSEDPPLKQPKKLSSIIVMIGAPERIRTSGLCLRRAALYPAELRVPGASP